MKTKKHRLPLGAYKGQRKVAFTACIDQRRELFVNSDIVAGCRRVLEHVAPEFHCTVPIYCFMPDHAHLIFQGETEQANAKLAMDSFKHRTGLWLGTRAPEFAWQDDYYDRILRKSQDWQRVLFYFAGNPVRAGLAYSPLDYPYSGSVGFDLKTLICDSYYTVEGTLDEIYGL